MENIIISQELIQNAITEAMPEIIKDKLSSSYSSPLAKVVDEELKKNDGMIREFVSKIIADALSDVSFKEKLGQAVLSKIVEHGLKH